MLKSHEEGVKLVIMIDPEGRRGLWMKREGDRLRFFAGREGDDEEVNLVEGETITSELLERLAEIVVLWNQN